MHSIRGVSLLETLVTMTIALLVAAAAVPAMGQLASSARTTAAARRMASTLQGLRWQSIASGRAHGLLFDRDVGGWFWSRVRDGNGNGLRTAEVRIGVDATLSGPHRLADEISHARLGFPPDGPFRRVPPRGGWIDDLDDPLRIGRSEILSFSPLGSSTSGTLYVTDGRRGLMAIVLYGRTGRIRVWRHDPESRRWTL